MEQNQLVEKLIKRYELRDDTTQLNIQNRVDRNEVVGLIHLLRSLLFPGFFNAESIKDADLRGFVHKQIDELIPRLSMQIEKALRYASGEKDVCAKKIAGDLANEFLGKLPSIREMLELDVDAAFSGDPAATSKRDVILSYPGLYAIMVSRIAHELYILDIPLIPRLMTEYAHSRTGIDIHPGASLGKGFFIDHGTGIVIGETTEIGENVKIYQGVTLGAHSTRGGQALRGKKRHPTVRSNVTIYAGASILGGDTVIGEGSIIGSNVFITSSIMPYTSVSIKGQQLEVIDKNTVNIIDYCI
jgi:serine O-acetyltransferase